MSDYFDLGRYSRPASDVHVAQIWFDRGLVWLFAYNHEEAIECFEKALASDPACALAHDCATSCLEILLRAGHASWHSHLM